ncbi:MAG TPA: phosphatase PAP2 family protein [Parvibaculum sp.]|jgi:membrane-associated phospholipid phosphatase
MHRAEFLHFITGFGDQAVVLPFVAVVAIALAAMGARREALYWCVAIFVALFGALIAKIVFLPCGHLIPELDLRSPSGHTAAAVAAYGGFAMLWVKFSKDRRTRAMFISAAIIGCVGIAASRVLIHVHTMPEVLLGGFIGLSAPTFLARMQPPESEATPRPTLLLLLVPLVLVLALRGATLPVEGLIDHLSLQLMAWFGVCG